MPAYGLGNNSVGGECTDFAHISRHRIHYKTLSLGRIAYNIKTFGSTSKITRVDALLAESITPITHSLEQVGREISFAGIR